MSEEQIIAYIEEQLKAEKSWALQALDEAARIRRGKVGFLGEMRTCAERADPSGKLFAMLHLWISEPFPGDRIWSFTDYNADGPGEHRTTTFTEQEWALIHDGPWCRADAIERLIHSVDLTIGGRKLSMTDAYGEIEKRALAFAQSKFPGAVFRAKSWAWFKGCTVEVLP